MDKVVSLSCTFNGIVCSGSLDHQVKLWKLDFGGRDQAQPVQPDQHQDQITSVESCFDGFLVASACR